MFKKRVYDSIFEDHLTRHRQMLFVTGPRQVGKTTTCRALGTSYQTRENIEVQRAILKGTPALAERLELNVAKPQKSVVVFDELHKFPKWKQALKGHFDEYEDRCQVVVTGSSRLDIYRRGGDSLMGRYFLYRMHPFSVAECARATLPLGEVQAPQKINDADWQALWDFGGFPEPFFGTAKRISTASGPPFACSNFRKRTYTKTPWSRILRSWGGGSSARSTR